MKHRDLRTSLPAKCLVMVLLLLCAAGVMLFGAAAAAMSAGCGVYDSFEQDPLCTNTMDGAARSVVEALESGSDYARYQLEERYAGYSAQVYRDGNLTDAWGDIPSDPLARRESRVDDACTVVGYLSPDLPLHSVFDRNLDLYNSLHSMQLSAVVFLTALLALSGLASLVFLLSAAGHRAGREGIVLGFQDRIPLDLYLSCALCLFVLCIAMLDRGYHIDSPFLELYLAWYGTCLMGAVVVALATLMTLAVRFKKGRWWRNSICFFLIHWCWRIWKRGWDALAEFAHALPLTWKAVLFTGAVLAAQTFLTLIMFDSYDSGFFFLVALVMDITLVMGAAALSLQLQKVRDMGQALAAGDLDAQLDTRKMLPDIRRHAENLNAIGVGMNRAVEPRMRSERLKTELITNVSHDIKTPLTSIVNYVDLLKKEDLPPAAAEYAAVLDRQSAKLKKLTEDLVEASKASTGNVSVSLAPIVVNEIILQAIGDYDERLTKGRLEVVVSTYEGSLMAMADGRLLWRVLDNLLSNVCKYAMPGTRVYVDLGTREERMFLTMKNISQDPLNVSAEELMERFVRGDASRHTEGSGLGLNIARSLMDLMGGTFDLSIDGDLFKAELTLPAAGPAL